MDKKHAVIFVMVDFGENKDSPKSTWVSIKK